MARRDKSRGFWIGVTCFILVAAIIFIVFATGTNGFKDWSFSRFYPKHNTEEQQESEEGATVLGKGENQGIALASMEIPVAEYAMYGVDRSAQNAYNLTASFVPENTTFQEVDYSLYFDTTSKPEYATWAQGKDMSQYAEVTQNATDSRKATVTFKNSFSAPIMIKAASHRNSSICATIRADYVCGSCFPPYTAEVEDVHTSLLEEGTQITWSNGTIIPSASESKIVYKYDFGVYFVTQMAAKGYTVDRYYEYTLEVDDDWQLTEDAPCIKDMLMQMGGTAASANSNEYWGAVGKCFLGTGTPENCSGGELCTYGYGFKRAYNGITYSDFTEDVDAESNSMDMEDWSGFEIQATSMGVTDDGGSSSLVLG